MGSISVFSRISGSLRSDGNYSHQLNNTTNNNIM